MDLMLICSEEFAIGAYNSNNDGNFEVVMTTLLFSNVLLQLTKLTI